jgi:hypothetical protein
MKLAITCLASALMLGLAVPAAAQTAKKAVKKVDPAVERAKKRCIEQHGVDCDTREGLQEWLILERPMTPEQQRSAVAARGLRESCARTKGNAVGC